MKPLVRLATEADLEQLVGLCAEHAEYERATIDAAHLRRSLGSFLFSEAPRASCAVIEIDGSLAGYATWSREFSTWHAADYVHMDCLYLVDRYRNRGLGRELLDEVVRAARDAGCSFIEWQTPRWNTDAMRFYGRTGARGSEKVRYRLDTDQTLSASTGSRRDAESDG